MNQQIPLFPLQTVLYPGAPLTLHIFEERYRAMIARCLQEKGPFGVTLIRSGSEVSPDDPWVRRMLAAGAASGEAPASQETVPHPVGTSARISDSMQLDDGRYYLVATGVRRFRIQHIAQRQPYLVAAVSYLDDERRGTEQNAAQLRKLYARYWAALGAATGQQYEQESLPDDPVEMSYALAHQLKVDNARKQHWLEVSTQVRLRELCAALRDELALLPAGGPTEGAGGPWTWN